MKQNIQDLPRSQRKPATLGFDILNFTAQPHSFLLEGKKLLIINQLKSEGINDQNR